MTFGDHAIVAFDDSDNIVVTLTNDVSGTVEIPDNVGAMTIDLNGHDMFGDDGPAIRIVKGDGESGGGVAATRLAIVDTSEGEKGQIAGGGESAGIEVAARPESAPYLRGVVTARSVTASYQNLEPGVEWCAWQNLWKSEPWKTVAKAFAKAKPVEIVPSVPPVLSVPFTSGIITLKFAATGAVTASGKFVTGQDASGRGIVYSATCSSVLIPDGDGVLISPERSEHCEAMSLEACAPALPDAPDFRVFLYFAPKAGKFDGFGDDIPLVWDGVDFSVK